MTRPPIVLVHGLWNSPRLFDGLIKDINRDEYQLLTPNLPHQLGRTPIRSLAKKLDIDILNAFEYKTPIDLVGFSMGGIISRVWLQELGGARRTNRFISIGTPHNGTYTAQWIPSCSFTGIADMKRGSNLLLDLNSNFGKLKHTDCISFFCKWDLMVFPGSQAKLPFGEFYELPVLTHKQLLTDPISLEILSKSIFMR